MNKIHSIHSFVLYFFEMRYSIYLYNKPTNSYQYNMFYLNYYSPTFIGRSCYYQKGDIQEYKQYATVAQNA